MINSKRAHQAERSGCRSESEMLSFGASLFTMGYPAEEGKQQDRFDEARIHYVF